MRKRWLIGAGVLFGCWTAAPDAQAGVLFFVNDPAGFAAATASFAVLGSEDWSSGAATGLQAISDPLQPGVAKSVFPHGVEASTGMTVQSNTLGNAGTTAAPGGNLAFAPQGYVGASGNVQASDQLSALTNGHGFDMIFGGAGVEQPDAVSFSPMFYRTTAPNDSGTISVRVFGMGGAQLGTTSVANVVDVSEASFLGVIATESDVIGRVNLWAASNAVAGADEIVVLAAPEPGAAGAGAVSLAALLVARRQTIRARFPIPATRRG